MRITPFESWPFETSLGGSSEPGSVARNRLEMDRGPLLISLTAFRDERGFFVERFNHARFAKAGLRPERFVQDNFSRSNSGVVRGLHAQSRLPQGKFVTCLSGRIFDVAVDARVGSPAFGRYASAILSGDEPRWFWIPPGFLHGFCVLGDQPADVLYKITAPFDAGGEIGVRWDDPDLAIPWPLDREPILSGKDASLPSFRDLQRSAESGEIQL